MTTNETTYGICEFGLKFISLSVILTFGVGFGLCGLIALAAFARVLNGMSVLP